MHGITLTIIHSVPIQPCQQLSLGPTPPVLTCADPEGIPSLRRENQDWHQIVCLRFTMF